MHTLVFYGASVKKKNNPVILSLMLQWPFPVWKYNKESSRMCSLPQATQKVFSYPWFLAVRSDPIALGPRRPQRERGSEHPRNCAFTHPQRQKTPTQRNKHLEPHHSALICHSWVQSPSRGAARRWVWVQARSGRRNLWSSYPSVTRSW